MEVGYVIGIIIGGLIAGIIIGPLARLIMPGRQSIGLFTTILIGAAGAIIGGFIYGAFGGGETSGIDWILHGVQLAVAIVLILIVQGMRGR